MFRVTLSVLRCSTVFSNIMKQACALGMFIRSKRSSEGFCHLRHTINMIFQFLIIAVISFMGNKRHSHLLLHSSNDVQQDIILYHAIPVNAKIIANPLRPPSPSEARQNNTPAKNRSPAYQTRARSSILHRCCSEPSPMEDSHELPSIFFVGIMETLYMVQPLFIQEHISNNGHVETVTTFNGSPVPDQPRAAP